MEKKELKNIIPEFQVEKTFDKETDYYIEEIEKADVTCWGIYKKIKGTQYMLLLIHFFDKESWITYTNNKWLRGKIDSLRYFENENFYKCQFSMKYKYDKLANWEYKKEEKKREEHYEKQLAEFKETNKAVSKKIPANFYKYINKKVMPGYAIYNNKEHKAKCTTCNEEFSINNLKRNEKIVCPHCKKEIKCLPSGKFKIYDKKYACYIQKIKEDRIVLRYFLIIHEKDKEYDSTYKYEVRRDFIDLNTGIIEPYIWEQFKSYRYSFIPEKYHKNSFNYFSEKDYWIEESNLWKGNINNIPKLRYILKNINIENERQFTASDIIGMLIRYPFLETWIKLGKNIRLITANLNNIKSNITEPAKAIGIPKNILRQIPNDSDTTIIPNIQILLKEKINITNTIIKYLSKNKLKIEEDLTSWKKNDSFKMSKVINYITQNDLNFADYRDYFSKITQLDRKLNKNLLCPANFKQAHDEILLENKYKDERIKEEKYKKIKENSIFKEIELDDLIIRLPESIREIVAEGLQQSNCVGTYIDRIINKQTTVLFARKTDQPNIPYITIEIKDNTVAQARYAHNINCETFIYEKISKYLKIINKKEHKAA